MLPRIRLRSLLPSLLVAAGPALAGAPAGFGLDVLVDGVPRPEYAARGTVYVEALRGRDFALRLTNPLGVRVAVALSVDGLNTIDARRTSAQDARKWVLDPYQTVVIPGWQISGETSRRFFFTGEKHSYGATLGQTANLGTIEAVFFRERLPYRVGRTYRDPQGRISSNEKHGERDAAKREQGRDAEPDLSQNGLSSGVPDAAPPEPQAGGARDHSKESPSSSSDAAAAEAQRAPLEPPGAPRDPSQKLPSPFSVSALSDDLAATGMGRRTRFEITRVDLDLEERPAASVRIRYEFRPQLVALGVLPRDGGEPIARREAARGFEEFCPEPR